MTSDRRADGTHDLVVTAHGAHQLLQWNIGSVHRNRVFSSCREWMICANEFS